MSVTAGDVKDALRRRYCKADGSGEQYVCIEEARSGAGFDGNNGSCDFLAINTFTGRGMELIGHEVKVSLADWKAEVAQPEKAERFARYCRRWFVAVPATLAAKIKDEVPPAWGLLSLSEKGRWTEVVKAPARKGVEDVPVWWWIGWLAQFDRQAKRSVGSQVQAAMEIERATIADRVKADVARAREYDDQRAEALRENVQRLKEATGIDLAHAWQGDFTRLANLWDIGRGRGDLDRTINLMRAALDALETLTHRDAEAGSAATAHDA